MKTRMGFVSNSSSTSFIITNLTDTKLTLKDFVLENPTLVEKFNLDYGYEYTQENMLVNAYDRNEIFWPGENFSIYGDEDGDILGQVFDYILRDGGRSASFKWEFHEYRR